MADHVLDADAAVAAPGEPREAGTSTEPEPEPAPTSTPQSAAAAGEAALLPDPPYFVGRRRELDGLRADIDRPGLDVLRGQATAGSRVLLVAGRPGSGRTALAVRLAREVADRYPGGQYFVRLGNGNTAEQAARTLLRAVGVEARDDAQAAARTAFAGRRAVLVLDDVAEPQQLLDLLPEGAGSLVVATSDGPLPGVPDVRPCTLGGLDGPAALDLLAQSIGPVRITNDPRAAEVLAQECGGHPAALRLIAAWLAAQPRMSVTDATRLLRAVPEESSDPLARAFRLVYGALAQPVARMLRLLALAPAGLVDAQIASALAGCSVGAAQSTLDDLTGCGLLEAGPTHHRVPGCLAPMLRELLETLDRPGELRLAQARMLERTVRLLQACRVALAPATGTAPATEEIPPALRFPSQAAAGTWLRVRLPVLLAAVRTAVADGELDTLARRLVAGLVRALAADPEARDTTAERYQLHTLVLDVAGRRGLHREKAAALINLGDLDAEGARPLDALDRYRAALVAAREGFDGDAEGRALEAIAGTYLELDDPQRASDWYGRALALRQTRGELVHQARLHSRLGALHTYAGRYGPALREWKAAVAAHRRLRDLPAQARAMSEVARVQEYAGHPEEALRTCRDALYWAREAGEKRLEGAVLLRMADTLERLGDPAGARLQRAAARRLLPADEVPGDQGV
ncbi:NB-ARC domain-containing protein [Streptomyces sp. NPDC059373]